MFNANKLGCLPSPHDSRTIRLRQVLADPQPHVPDSQYWDDANYANPVLANDRYGCCVPAALGHRRIVASLASAEPDQDVTDNDVLSLYSAVTGFDRKSGRNDNGTNVLDLLKHVARKQWLADPQFAFLYIGPTDSDSLRRALAWFGPALICLALPVAWQATDTWHISGGRRGRPATWGYHCVCATGYDDSYLSCRTWGTSVLLSWPAMAYYGTEAWLVLDGAWAETSPAPNALDLDELSLLLSRVTPPSALNRFLAYDARDY